jgi:tetratricopeptide (TPR) repeat protein
MGDYQKALDIYDKILQTNKYDTQIRIAKGKFLAALGKPQDAIKEFQVVLLIYPDSMQAKYGIYKTLKGKASIDEIVQQFYPLDVPNTANSEFYYKFGEFLTDANDNDDAIIFYNKAVETDSKNLNAYLALYKTYEVSANNAKSYEIIKKAYQNLPNAPEIRELYSSINSGTSNKKNELALSYIKNNDYAKAIALYQQIEPKSIEIYFSLSNCYKALKDYKKATQVLQDAAKANPANSDIYYAIAVLYLDQNSPQTAKSYLKKSISLNKENLKAIKLLSFLEKKEINVLLDNAYTSYEKGEYREAEAILTKAIKEFPNAPQIYYYRGLVYEAQKNYVEALKDYTEVTKLAPNYDMVYYAIGSLLEKCGKEREALEAYERFLSGDIEDKALIKEVQDKVIKLGDKYY